MKLLMNHKIKITMKKRFLVIMLIMAAFAVNAQTLYNTQIIGQTTRNQKVGKGLEITDTLLPKGVVQLANYKNGGDSVLTTDNTGKLKFVASGVQTFSIKVHVDTAEIRHSGVTPVTLIPAPGVGKFLHNINITAKFNFGTLVYNTNTTCKFIINLYESDTSFSLNFNQTLFSNSDVVFQDNPNTIENQALKFYTPDGNPEDGDGTLDFYITYQIINL